MKKTLWWVRLICIGFGAIALRLFAPWWCARDADAWLRGDVDKQVLLATALVAFEKQDDLDRQSPKAVQFTGRWALLTHHMTALGLAQVVLAHPELKATYVPVITNAAIKSFGPEMRSFGSESWNGEDAMKALEGPHGHAYLAFPALAMGMARLLDPSFPKDMAKRHDALIAALEKKLLASDTGLIETYPNESYPADVAAVAAAIAVHGRATGAHHEKALAHWADHVRAKQVDPESGFVFQRMGMHDGKSHDAPRGSGTALAAYYAGFADRSVAKLLSERLFHYSETLFDFEAIREYPDGRSAFGDSDSGPAPLGVSLAATGFSLGPARAFGHKEDFTRLYRSIALIGVPFTSGNRERFLMGGPIGSALLLALLTSGPEIAP